MQLLLEADEAEDERLLMRTSDELLVRATESAMDEQVQLIGRCLLSFLEVDSTARGETFVTDIRAYCTRVLLAYLSSCFLLDITLRFPQDAPVIGAKAESESPEYGPLEIQCPAATQVQRERSVKIKLNIEKTYFENKNNTILKIKDLAEKIK